MKVIFVGYSKCGTKTMCAAYKALGYKVCDFLDNMYYLEKDWAKIFNEGSTVDDFKRMYANYDACTGAPAYQFWEEILEAFPDAKLMVWYREEEAWMKSFITQMEMVKNNTPLKILSMLSPTAQRMARSLRLFVGNIWGGDRNTWPWQTYTQINYSIMRHRYRQHNTYLQQKAPKDRIHVVNIKDGWEPICKFLGEPVPDVPFPWVNKGGQIVNSYLEENPIIQKMKREAMISVSVLFALLAGGAYYLFHRFY